VKTVAGGGFALVGRVRAQSTRLFNEGVRSFLGGNLIASSDVAYGTDGIIRFSRLRLNAPQLRVTDGRGSYSPDGRIDLRARACRGNMGRSGCRSPAPSQPARDRHRRAAGLRPRHRRPDRRDPQHRQCLCDPGARAQRLWRLHRRRARCRPPPGR
jgi:hypothetical protein